MNPDDADTKPTIETVLERINSLGETLHAEIKGLRVDTERIDGRIGKIDERIDRIDARLEKFGERFDELDQRLDRIESVANRTRSEFLDMRMDFRAWRDKLKGLLPQAN